MKEHYAKKLKRELLEVKQALFAVCNYPESMTSQSIITEQKFLKSQGNAMMQGNAFYHKVKDIGFGLIEQIQQKHWEGK